MTPISHSMFGFAAGFILSPATAKFGISRAKTVVACTIGSLLPDVDTVWLVLNRDIYFGSDWYSHHAITHSFFGALLLSILFSVFLFSRYAFKSFADKDAAVQYFILIALVYIGCLMHLPGDLVTLPGPWNGIPLFAPYSWDRFGGWSHIPWKDYFLIFMSIATYVIFAIICLAEMIIWKHSKKYIVLSLCSICVICLACYHVYNSRFTNYKSWNAEQRKLVGDSAYDFMEKAERKISRLWHIKTAF